MKKPTHGGKRPGAGRPKTKEDTVVMRVPKSLVPKIKGLIKRHVHNKPFLDYNLNYNALRLYL